jgi:pimeloyl-ACP methyl ester carboxylesterase
MSKREGVYTKVGMSEFYANPIGNGSPTVIIETAWGSLSLEWKSIQEEISKETTCLLYDRAGYGESSYASSPRTGKSISFELKKILENTNIKPPYILVGHSSGAIYSQSFALEYPETVAGMILVEPITVNDDDFNKLKVPNYQKMFSVQARMENIKSLLKLDVKQFSQYISQMLKNVYNQYPEEIRYKLIEYQSDPSFFKTVLQEYNSRKDSFRYLKQNQKELNFPVTIISRDSELMIDISGQAGLPKEEAIDVENLWQLHLKSLLEISPFSKFVLAKNSNHQIHVSKPNVIIEEIIEMIRK